ncbi:MAG: glycosidase [Chloroflexi bacterium]|nr:glycosidase [Chloroflexota bacterium]
MTAKKLMLKRFEGNPILEPIEDHKWESAVVFNCGVVRVDDRTHILYRAQDGRYGVSRLGYASTADGFHIDERLPEPVFSPEEGNPFECFGVEDPRLVRLGDRIYISYTAFGILPDSKEKITIPQIGMTSISVDDFINKRWKWGKRSYPFPRVSNKNCAVFPEKINGRYAIIHRIAPHIWLGYSDDMERWTENTIIMSPEYDWEYVKIGLGCPPVKTEKGWMIVYHGVDKDLIYRLSIVFLDLENPGKILYRHRVPVFEPAKKFEKQGNVPNVVFTCGAAVHDGRLFVYYGGADNVIGVATAEMKDVLGLF